MIFALLRAQLLTMRVGARRGATLGIAAAALWYGLWSLAACAAFGIAATAEGPELDYALPLALLGVLLYWQIVPVFSAAMGSSLDLRKLLHYPVPHSKLFVMELLLRLTAGIEMLMVLIGGTAGLLSNRATGGWICVPRVSGAVLLFIAFNVLLASGVRSLLERLLARRRVREAVVFAILLLWMAPRLLALSGVSMEWLHSAGAALGGLAWPWSAGARAAFPERPVPLWLAFASLCCWTGAAAWFGRAQFERSLRYDTAAAQATPSAATPAHALVDRFYRFPGLIWRDPLAAIVEKELRTLARSPRFRVVFLMGFTFGLAVWLPLALGDRGGELSRYFFPVVCLYAMILMGQVSYWNCFGLDRSAAQIYFIAPGPFRTALAGKNIASLVYIYLEVAIVSAVTAALRLVTGWGQLAETAAAVGVGALYLMAIGNLSSVRYPRPLNPDRASQGGSSGRVQALVFLLFPLALAPVVLAYLARYAFDSQAVFDVFLAIAGAGGVALYRASLQSAASAATERRETLIQQLSRGEGPVASA